MSINLVKDQKINLTKQSDTLKKVTAILSWETPTNVFPKYDLDVSAFMLNEDSKLIADEGMVFYNNESSPDGSVSMSGDEREGGSEELYIDIDKISTAVNGISVVVTIHKAEERKQSFDQVKDAKITIINSETNESIAMFALNEVTKGSTAVHVGTFFQTEGQFSFHAIADSYNLSLADFVNGYSK
jgi:tellurium resistance protein TerD